MTPSEIALVRASFAKVAPIADQAASLFYARLFEIAPEVRPLFKGDMTEQGRKLMATFGFVVHGLDKLETIVPAATELARRHVAYGVQPAHYEPVGAALLWTLQTGLGPQFTPEARAAWTTAYGALSATMIAAAYPDRSEGIA